MEQSLLPVAVAPRALKRRVKLLLRALSAGWHTGADIARQVQALGVRRGEILLVHSSLSSLGYVPGGARTVIDALLSVVGPAGTLVMPTHSWDRSGHGDFTFDVRLTPSCVGRISEAFRTLPQVIRSLHPTHSVAAWGPCAKEITEGHENAGTPCGIGTPYAKLIEANCQVLFLGTTLDSNTLFHTLEALAPVPYLLRDEDESFVITDAGGHTRVMRIRRHFRGPDRRFLEMKELLLNHGVLRKGNISRSESLLLESASMATLILDRLKNDTNFLVN